MAKKKISSEPKFDIFGQYNNTFEIPIDGMDDNIMNYILDSSNICRIEGVKENLKLWHSLRIRKHGVCACSVKSYIFKFAELKKEFSDAEIECIIFMAYSEGWRGLDGSWYKSKIMQRQPQQPQQRNGNVQIQTNLSEMFLK